MKKFFATAIGTLLFVMQTGMALASFSDVHATDPQAPAIEDLQLRKVINGYPDKTFKPNNLITRGEFLKMVLNDVGYKPAISEEKLPFEDVPANNWTAPYIKKALEINVINANGAKPLFNPGKPVTRAEAIKIAFAIAGVATPYYTDIDPSELFQDVPPKAWYGYLARAAKRNNIVSLKRPELFWANHLMTRGDTAELIYQLQQVRENEGLTDTGNTTTFVLSPAPTGFSQTDSDLLNNAKFSILLDVWEKSNNQFYDKSKINKDELVYAAIKGMVDKLGDQYTVFEEPEDANNLRQFLQGQFEGIGTEMEFVDGKMVIKKIIPGSPAEKAKLQTGDVIQKIDGKSIEKLTVTEVVNLIRGDAGTTVTLSIQRGSQMMDVKVTRAKVTLSSVNGKMINTTAFIEINEFTKTTDKDFTNTLNELNKQSPNGYIIDLRDNPGGYVESTVQLLGHFVEKDKTVVSMKTAGNENEQFHSPGPGELKGKTIILLVNKASASSAEIMAGALQDLKIAKLVGTVTRGKGSVQEISNYTDKSLLKLTIAHWLTPNGRDINGKGLTPEIIVELDQNLLLKGTDNQLQKALEIISANAI